MSSSTSSSNKNYRDAMRSSPTSVSSSTTTPSLSETSSHQQEQVNNYSCLEAETTWSSSSSPASSSSLPSSVLQKTSITIIEEPQQKLPKRPQHRTIEKDCKKDTNETNKKKKKYNTNNDTNTNKWCSLLFGQFIAVIATCQNASSFTLQYGLHGVKFPMFLMFHVYIILALIHLLPKVIFLKKNNASHSDSEEEEKEKEESYSSSNSKTVPRPPPNSTTITATRATTRTSTTTGSGSNKSPYRYTMPIFTKIKLLVPWYYYMFLSILDVLPNWMTLLALQYTSLTSTTLLGSLTVPAAMIVCKVLLRKTYHKHHYLGVLICMIGATLTIFSDEITATTTIAKVSNGEGNPMSSSSNFSSSLSSSSSSHPQSHIGDLFAIIAALLYGAQDAIGEYWLKHVGDRQEYLGMLGLFGTMYTLILFPIMDGNQVLDFIHTLIVAISSSAYPDNDDVDIDNQHMSLVAVIPTIVTMVWFVSSVVIFYIATAYFLTWNDATLLILSLQACNIWAILYSVVAYHDTPSTLFYVAMSLVIGGVFLYEMLDSSSSSSSSPPSSLSAANDDRYAYQDSETSKLLKRTDSDSTTDDSSKSSSSSSSGGGNGVGVSGSDVASLEDDSYHGYDCWYYGSTANV